MWFIVWFIVFLFNWSATVQRQSFLSEFKFLFYLYNIEPLLLVTLILSELCPISPILLSTAYTYLSLNYLTGQRVGLVVGREYSGGWTGGWTEHLKYHMVATAPCWFLWITFDWAWYIRICSIEPLWALVCFCVRSEQYDGVQWWGQSVTTRRSV